MKNHRKFHKYYKTGSNTSKTENISKTGMKLTLYYQISLKNAKFDALNGLNPKFHLCS